ncbi:MAG: 30S ribosomal protein S11 [bacterium]
MAKKKTKMEVPSVGLAYITSGFNNTIITLTNAGGDVICRGSPGAAGFKGGRRSTPYASSQAATQAGAKALALGLKEVDVFVKGPGSGRDSAVKALRNAGLRVKSITDITPIPHNGCRPKGKRRI